MLEKILKKYESKINGIIQVGANSGQELDILTKYPINIYLFEPIKLIYEKLLKKSVGFQNVKTYNIALGDKNEEKIINIASNNAASSSLLDPTQHLKFFPEIIFDKKEKVRVERFDEIDEELIGNFLILDVQGYELKVLEGFGSKISQIDFIYTEFSLKQMYKNNVLISELDNFLRFNNFTRTKTKPNSNKPQGDALYVRLNNKALSHFYSQKAKLQISRPYLLINLFTDVKKTKFIIKNLIKKTFNL